MEKVGAKPKNTLVDSGYWSDENVENSAKRGVEFVAPTTGKEKNALGLEECQLFMRQKTTQSTFEDGKGRAVLAGNVCGN